MKTKQLRLAFVAALVFVVACPSAVDEAYETGDDRYEADDDFAGLDKLAVGDECDNISQCSTAYGKQATNCVNARSRRSWCRCGRSRCVASPPPPPPPPPSAGWTTLYPAKNEGPDKNPLKGWNSGWWNDHTWASVGFQYIPWKALEPTNNRFDWNAVENILNREGSRGRHVIVRFYCDWMPNYDGPDWLLDMVQRRTSGGDAATDYDDPDFVREATEAIRALVSHYEDDPRMFIFQLGTIGYWGEWHNHPHSDWFASVQTQQAVIDAYKNSVSQRLINARYPWANTLTGNTTGIGYYNDYFSAAGHSRDFDRAIDARSLWKQGHIGGEWPPGRPDQDFIDMFNSPLGEQVIREGHYSSMQAGVAVDKALPQWSSSFFKLHRLMGYNFQVQNVRYAVPAAGRGTMSVEVDVKNIGVAPFYMDWDVQLALLNDNNEVVVTFDQVDPDLRKWGPAETHTLSGSKVVGLDLTKNHRIALRILQPRSDINKTTRWSLDARNVYVVLANQIEVVPGSWNASNALQGGWNILGRSL